MTMSNLIKSLKEFGGLGYELRQESSAWGAFMKTQKIGGRKEI